VNRTEEFIEFVRKRRSIRKYSDAPIPRETVLKIVEAAGWAPSASNRQDWEFTVITSQSVKEKMAEIVRSHWQSIVRKGNTGAVTEELQRYMGNFDWFGQAPVLVVISAKRSEAFLGQILGDAAEDIAGTGISAAMAAQNLMLAAHASGIGSCCVTGPLVAQEALKELLAIGKRRKIVCIIALGYPAEQPEAPVRKPVERIVKYIE
jgi:nitroreductase